MNKLATLGLTALLLGCGSVIPRANEEDLLQYRKMELANAPQAVSCLKEGEYLIPDVVLDVYARIIDPHPITFWGGGPIAGTIDHNYLQGQENEFLLKLGEKGYSKKESQVFYTILSMPGNIFFKQSESKAGSFRRNLFHERVHREVRTLTLKEQEKIYNAHKQLKKHVPPQDPEGPFFEDKAGYAGFATMAVDLNWKEFFPYLAQGALEDYVEEALKTEFPEAYDLFLGVKERAKVECPK